MPTLIAMVGLPRSGKSIIVKALSKQLSAPIVKKDDIRLALHGKVYEKLAEPFVRAISKVMIHSLFLSGHEHVIADETHVSREARDFVRDGPWETKFLVVPTTPEVCIERAFATGHTWLPPVIEEMAGRWEPLGKDEERFTGFWGGEQPQAERTPEEKRKIKLESALSALERQLDKFEESLFKETKNG